MPDEQPAALVTNASDFAGPPAVDALLQAGYRVLAHDRTFAQPDVWQRFAEQRGGLERIESAAPDACIAEAFERAGRLDAIVSNDHHPAKSLATEALPVEELRISLERLVVDPFVLVGAAVPQLKRQGGGNIVMITSNRTRLPMAGGAIPDAARAGANALVRSLAIELAPHDIALNAVAPNFLYSEAYYPKAVFKESAAGRAYVRDSVPLGRLGEPREMGELFVFLAGAKARFLTGAIIDFSGGWPVGAARPEA